MNAEDRYRAALQRIWDMDTVYCGVCEDVLDPGEVWAVVADALGYTFPVPSGLG